MSSNQNTKVKVEIESVQETLLTSLWCRAAENRKDRPILVDPKASEVVGRLDYDFGKMERSLKEPILLISNIGSRNCDTAAKGFPAIDKTPARIDNKVTTALKNLSRPGAERFYRRSE